MTMVMQTMRKGAAGGVLKYLLFGILGMAVGGLALMDVGGVFRNGGVGGSDVVKLADKTISIRQFDGALRRAISQYGISTQQAHKMGMTQNILAAEIRSTLLQEEAENLGVEIPKDYIAKRIAEVVNPQKTSDQSLQETLEGLLRNQGLSEKEFVEGIKREMSVDMLLESLQAGFRPNNHLLAQDLYLFKEQTRNIEMIIFPDADVTGIESPKENQLRHLYESLKPIKFSIPEYRSAQMIIYDPAKITNEFSATEEEMRAVYEENTEHFTKGEQYVLSQAIIDDQEKANAIYKLTLKGEDLKTAISQIMGEGARFLENVPFEKRMMLPALIDALSGKEPGTIAPPVKTTLGYHVVEMVEMRPPAPQPYEAVKSVIEADLLEMKRSDYFYEVSTKIDDMLTRGVTFEDISKEIDVSIMDLPFTERQGIDESKKPVLEELDEADKNFVIESLFEIEEGMTPFFQELPSGKFAAIALKERHTETYRPFEEVKEEIQNQFLNDQRRALNKEQIRRYLAEIGTGGSTFETIAKENKKQIKKIENIKIEGELSEPLTDGNRPTIFQAAIGGYDALYFEDMIAIIKVTGFSLPQIEETTQSEIVKIQEELSLDQEEEALSMYLFALNSKYPAKINDRLLDRVYGQPEN